MRWYVTIALLFAACGTPAAAPIRSDPASGPTATASGASEPTVSDAPVSAYPTPVSARLGDVTVTVASSAFPMELSIPLHVVTPSPDDVARARHSVTRYLEQLDSYRRSARPGDRVPVQSAKFGEAVSAALRASAIPGVERTFVLESLRVDRLVKKPWGTPAYAHVTVTIVDRDVSGRLADQRETGRLRLDGHGLFVADGWDHARNTWYEGPRRPDPVHIRSGVRDPIAFHLRTESWVRGSPLELFGSPDETPYWAARHAYIRALDRATMLSRSFSDVIATVERFDGSDGIAHGLATVRIDAIASTERADGTQTREPWSTRLKVLFGNWSPEIVDEEASPGVWRSGGELALAKRDQNFA